MMMVSSTSEANRVEKSVYVNHVDIKVCMLYNIKSYTVCIWNNSNKYNAIWLNVIYCD